MALAPIVLFVYDRPWHARQTIEALRGNTLARQSDLFIYSDGPGAEDAVRSVSEVRRQVRSIDGFSNVTIIERDTNLGLAASIVDGVTTIVRRYGKVIVLEDDHVTSPHFLMFMNRALEIYACDTQVWHISGWNYPIPRDEEEDVFFWRAMNCWGWATWVDRWKYFRNDTEAIVARFSPKEIHRFNLEGKADFWSQMVDNAKGKIDTWAIYWYATIFLNGGLCLNPVQTFVDNIGIDGSGQHCGKTKTYIDRLNPKGNIAFGADVRESEKYVELIKQCLSEPALTRAAKYLRSLIRWR